MAQIRHMCPNSHLKREDMGNQSPDRDKIFIATDSLHYQKSRQGRNRGSGERLNKKREKYTEVDRFNAGLQEP